MHVLGTEKKKNAMNTNDDDTWKWMYNGMVFFYSQLNENLLSNEIYTLFLSFSRTHTLLCLHHHDQNMNNVFLPFSAFINTCTYISFVDSFHVAFHWLSVVRMWMEHFFLCSLHNGFFLLIFFIPLSIHNVEMKDFDTCWRRLVCVIPILFWFFFSSSILSTGFYHSNIEWIHENG